MDTASELSRLLGPLRRAVMRASRSAAGLPDLPEAQIELLRALAAEGPLSPRTVAQRLRIAPSTVSNLVKTMVAAGLVSRDPDPGDLRAVVLTPSAAALDLLDRYDRTSSAALAHAIDQLPAGERDTLAASLPILAELVTALEQSG
ncbi:MarR family transcriptional regulator [Kitasatospora sp. RB6PN24]|uniref:MarR family winged helix-turn-helix transcriptional regulator n=1 Tax=Kitasatospora humi TaxID=2893891 RepID=UPI001E305672|nr:MarR family transcriptional regulator [Kitasatospora humi]MCC9311087.1 MarR family transcriptional regulator [Kitasatospora humi]